MPTYVIVAPHCYCSPKNPIRHCDRAANLAVDSLIAADIGRHVAYVQRSDKLRRLDHDYNRPNTDATQWRARLRDNIIKHHPDFVFETHSFPGDHEMYRTRWPGESKTASFSGKQSKTSCDLALFESEDNAPWIEVLAAKIRERAPLGAVVRVVKPWHPVAITDDVAAIKKSTPGCANMMHALIEFNEVADTLMTNAMAAAVYSAVDSLVRERAAARKDSIFGGDPYSGKYVFDPEIMHPASIGARDGFSTSVSGHTLVYMMLTFAFIILTLFGALGFAIGKHMLASPAAATSSILGQNGGTI